MNKYYQIGALILLILILVAGCGGGGDGGGSSGTNGSENTITISGTISIPSNQAVAPIKQHMVFSSIANVIAISPLVGAHVNVCTMQNNELLPLPAHPSVLTDSSGSFVISVDKNDVPSDRQMWVCASNAAGTFDVLVGIEEFLPEDLDEVTTVSVNPTLNTTIITRFQCSGPILLFNGGKCNKILDTETKSLLVNALDTFFSDNPLIIPDLQDFSIVFDNVEFQNVIFPEFDLWLPDIPDVDFPDFVDGAKNFVNPVIPLGLQGNLTGSWNGSCQISGEEFESVSGSFSASISATGIITGSISGDDSGSISGTASGTGNFSATAGSAGGASWSGSVSRSDNSLSGSGSWSSAGCSGSWSGSGAAST